MADIPLRDYGLIMVREQTQSRTIEANQRKAKVLHDNSKKAMAGTQNRWRKGHSSQLVVCPRDHDKYMN